LNILLLNLVHFFVNALEVLDDALYLRTSMLELVIEQRYLGQALLLRLALHLFHELVSSFSSLPFALCLCVLNHFHCFLLILINNSLRLRHVHVFCTTLQHRIFRVFGIPLVFLFLGVRISLLLGRHQFLLDFVELRLGLACMLAVGVRGRALFLIFTAFFLLFDLLWLLRLLGLLEHFISFLVCSSLALLSFA